MVVSGRRAWLAGVRSPQTTSSRMIIPYVTAACENWQSRLGCTLRVTSPRLRSTSDCTT